MTRNLNLAIQIRQMTGKVVIALNLMDEAQRSGIEIDIPSLSHHLGVPVIPMVARRKEGIPEFVITSYSIHYTKLYDAIRLLSITM